MASSKTQTRPKGAKTKAGGPATRVPNEVRRARSHEAVLDAAEKLFVRKGYGATSVDEIAAKAGLTKGAIYFHFDDKNAMLMALIDRAESRVIDPLISLLGEPGSPPDKLVEYIHYWARIGIEQRETMFLPILASLEFANTGDQIEKRLTRMYERLYAALIAIFEKGYADGTIVKSGPARDQAAIVIAMNEGMLLEWLRHTSTINGPAVVRGMRNMMISGFIRKPK